MTFGALQRTWRASARAWIRDGRDLMSGRWFSLVRRSRARLALGRRLAVQICEVQPIRRSEHWEAKVANVKRAVAEIDDVAIAPGETFSFWALVGPPRRRRGFHSGRTIVGGEVQRSVGGGLCQLSGILHAVALRAGLEIQERHGHSVDLYDDSNRFAPLGSDATVAYGYKDLRIRNVLPVSFCFRIRVDEREVSAAICAADSIEEHRVEHRIVERTPDWTVVETLRTGPAARPERVGTSRYRRLGGSRAPESSLG